MFGLEKRSALFLIAILALVGALVVAGCGGGGSSSSSETATTEEPAETAGPEEEATEEPAEEEPAEEEAAEEPEEEAGGGESAMLAEGKSIFTSTCGSCHTLKAAGTSGEVGPNLDELEPDQGTVEHQVQNGGGGMPAFGKEGTLSAAEIKAVATYVSAEAGN
jgi:mono/diheme cytochrome c family protein